jgi:hypothetical protein
LEARAKNPRIDCTITAAGQYTLDHFTARIRWIQGLVLMRKPVTKSTIKCPPSPPYPDHQFRLNSFTTSIPSLPLHHGQITQKTPGTNDHPSSSTSMNDWLTSRAAIDKTKEEEGDDDDE